MGLLTRRSVLRGGFLLPSSRVLGVCPGGMVMDEVDTCIMLNVTHYDFVSPALQNLMRLSRSEIL